MLVDAGTVAGIVFGVGVVVSGGVVKRCGGVTLPNSQAMQSMLTEKETHCNNSQPMHSTTTSKAKKKTHGKKKEAQKKGTKPEKKRRTKEEK